MCKGTSHEVWECKEIERRISPSKSLLFFKNSIYWGTFASVAFPISLLGPVVGEISSDNSSSSCNLSFGNKQTGFSGPTKT